MSSTDQRPKPVRSSLVIFGANQSWTLYPRKYSPDLSAPRTFFGVWQAPQWPGPSTRNAPRFHSADFCGSDLKRSSLKKRKFHTCIVERILNGKGSVFVTTGLRTG